MSSIDRKHTGERVLVEQYQSTINDYVIYLMHIASYQFAESFARGKRVLDYGCGSGYGSASIAAVAATVDAVDVSADAIAVARADFPRANLRFHTIAADAALPFRAGSFEIVLSFQVLEHVADTGSYLAEIQRVLTPGGILLLITPDRSHRLLPWQRPWNRWHVKEYSAPSLATTLRPSFPAVEIQQMSGDPEIVAVELRRYRKLKWLLLPFTLPVLPVFARVPLLNLIHAIRRRFGGKAPPRQFPFDVSSIRIGPHLTPSLNLVAVARKRMS